MNCRPVLFVLTVILASLAVGSCGEMLSEEQKKSGEGAGELKTSPSGTPDPTASPQHALDFSLHVNPALKSSCGGAICHGAGSAYGIYIDREDLFLAAGPQVIDRLTTNDVKKVMPKAGFPVQLKSTDKTTLLNYLKERGVVAATNSGTSANSGSGGVGSGSPTPAPSPSASPGFSQPPPTKLCANVSAAEKAMGAAMTFTEVTAIFTPNCGGGGCHSGAPLPRGFVGQESSLQDRIYSAGIVLDIQNGSMPKGRSMSDADKKAAIAYLCARHDF